MSTALRPLFRRLKPFAATTTLAALLTLAATAAHASQAVLSADASVNSARPTTNYGSLANLYVGNGNTTFLQYSLASLPNGTTASNISKATLTLFVNRVNTSGAISVSPVIGNWTESAVTYTNAPAIGSVATTFTPAAAGTYINIDITAIVQGWLNNPTSNLGLALTSPAPPTSSSTPKKTTKPATPPSSTSPSPPWEPLARLEPPASPASKAHKASRA